MFYLLADDSLVPNWVANSFPVIKFVLLLLILLASLAMIVVVLMQKSEGGDSMNSITGIKETYFAKTGGMNREAILKKITLVLSICIAVMVVLFFVLSRIYSGSLWS